MITSVSEKLSVADTEYNVLATDVQGNEDGSGVLLDSDGNVAGMILKKNKMTEIIFMQFPFRRFFRW